MKIEAHTYGCSDPSCGYRIGETTIPDDRTHCPLCGQATWTVDPPPRKTEREPKKKGARHA